MEINCRDIAAKIEERATVQGTPHLAVITTPEADDASHIYMRNKIRAAERCGIQASVITCESEAAILSTISALNTDPFTNGIIVQLPLPRTYNVPLIQSAIDPRKDVDGFHPNSHFEPCTPAGVLHLLYTLGYPLEGTLSVVIGRSDIVGKPLARLLTAENSTVTLCHSRTTHSQLTNLCRNANYIFCAAGTPNLIGADAVTPHTVCIDISINRDAANHLCGDLSKEAQTACAAYTPVPRGIGPITVAQLMYHTARAFENQKKI